MSVAGKRSSQGDEYQLRVALHWLIRLLEDNSIQGIQVNSVGIPDQDFPVTVDDIVVLYKDGHACFIQAKKNQTDHKAWSLSDEKLKVELLKACEQLESRENSEVKFYSRSPFGELKALVEFCKQFPDYSAFNRDAPGKQSGALKQLSNIIKRSEEVTFNLARRVSFGPTYEFEDWDRENDANLDRLVPRADLVKDILERYLDSHETNLRDSKYVITREDVLSQLAEKGLSPTPKRSEAEILKDFKVASAIGRKWLCTIDGKKIPRAELSQIIEFIQQGSRTILLTDRPGSGKTCLLLDLADYIEKSSPWGLLFIKGDQFTGVDAEQDLVAKGLPEDIVGQCARLAGFRRVVVVIDSLDVLSLSRQHSALKVFLGLMDRLERVDGVTVIAACRSFDLEYDPLLRGRSWQQTLNLQPLDFESVVKPFLCDWGINPSSISVELQRVLQVPQNLRIYEKLAKLGKALQPASAYELYDSFLEEVVAKNSRLGHEALSALQNMAEHLMQQRSQSCPKVAFGASENVVRELVSQEVLWEASPGVMQFSHQTLRDCLIVRGNLAKNRSLDEFIRAHPQLPFIRPAVRAFFFFLRAHQPTEFRRQVWQVLSHDEIAYHVKRLICESFAEIEPVEDDWRLLRRIFQNYPDLFRRLLSRVAGNAWFDILKQHWLPEVQTSQNREDWLRQFCWQLSIWANQYPADVIALWREAIASQWADRQSLIGVVRSGLDRFEAWNTEGVRELLETLVEYASTERDFLGNTLSRWVQATNSGDDLLWRYITRNVSVEDVRSRNLCDQLSCEPHEFHQENFLAERLSQSDDLLTLVLNDLERWSGDSAAEYGGNGLRSEFLYHTSWKFRHNQHDIYHVDSLTVLLDGLESALKHHSRQNKAWWQTNEPRLRATQEEGIRYLVIQAYKENIGANIPAIESQLQDEELFRWSNLSYELGELMQMAYPYISESVRVANQALLLSLHAAQVREIEGVPVWAYYREVYNRLIWIPCIFRIPDTQSLIDTWQDYFGYSRPSPDIHTWGGLVMSPLSSEDLLKLSDHALFRLLHYYEGCPGRDYGDLVGGFSEVKSVLREACSLEPRRFLDLFICFIEENLHQNYVHAVVEGIANHLRYRFGSLSPGHKWEPVTPLPEGEILAAVLLNWLERYPIIWEDARTVSQALRACCDVLDDPESAERLTLLLFWLRAKEPNDRHITNNEQDLLFIAINSIHGVVADSSTKLCNRLLDKGQSLPELLPFLLRHFARDSAIYVRVPILQQLPFLMYKQPDLGWQLLADVFQEPQPRLWKYAQRCLYYQYQEHFDRVEPYLNRLLDEGMEDAGDTWGRISTLASLAGHLSQEQLFNTLIKTNADAWRGAAQVFGANLNRPEHKTICHAGLMTILGRGNLSNEILQKIDQCFGEKANRGSLRFELARAFLETISAFAGKFYFHHFFDWLGWEAHRDPLSAMDLVEMLAEKLDTEIKPYDIGDTQPLIAALKEILSEADETDDPNLIQRAISLQDSFLRLDIYGIEELLAKAGQN
jgi:hypothetical protein